MTRQEFVENLDAICRRQSGIAYRVDAVTVEISKAIEYLLERFDRIDRNVEEMWKEIKEREEKK